MRSGRTSGTATVLFTDLVGSTELMARLGDTAFDELRGEHFARLRNDLEDIRGEFQHQVMERDKWLSAHPEATRRLDRLDRNLGHAERGVERSSADDLLDLLSSRGAIGRTVPERTLGVDPGIDVGP